VIGKGKHNVLGVLVDAVDYEEAVRQILGAAETRMPFAGTALAVHGVMTGYQDAEHRKRLNDFDLVVPDGQPVRWALNLLHHTGLSDRVYGPNLMLHVCAAAERRGVGIYLYGSTEQVLSRLVENLKREFPTLKISGAEPSKFARLSAEEKAATVQRIRESGAQITFVGLGCPRQEVWAYEYREALGMPVLAVGAAFDFHAGTSPQASAWMQKYGLEWLFRLKTEPRRLWKRYMLLNPWYSALIAMQALRLRRFSTTPETVQVTDLSYG
jgi:N-acetylglucosaminyldiphosphoundecaprenol N-acetyl-beta-D-mannosaminyltransferase